MDSALAQYRAAKRGEVYPLFARLAAEWGCHFRTVQDAVMRRVKSETVTGRDLGDEQPEDAA